MVMKIYGCEYRMEGSSQERFTEFKAKNETAARLKMMKFAEENNVFVQNVGKQITQ